MHFHNTDQYETRYKNLPRPLAGGGRVGARLDDEHLDLAVADAGLQQRQGGGRRRQRVGDQPAGYREDRGMTGTTKAVRSRIQKEEATLVGADRGHRLHGPPVVDDDAFDGTAGEANR